MDPVEGAGILKEIKLFEKLDGDLLYQFAAIAKRQTVHAGQDLVRQGDMGQRFYIFDKGLVHLRRTDPSGFEHEVETWSTYHPGAEVRRYFGEQMFSTQEPYDFTVYVVADTRMIYIDHSDFEAFRQKHPSIVEMLPFIAQFEQRRTRGLDWIGIGEKVELITRKHWWALAPFGLAWLGGVLISSIVTAALIALGGDAFWTLGVIVAVSALLAVVYIVYDWLNDEYVVTNRRIAHVERVFLTMELRESIPIEKVQSVHFERSGVAGYLNIGKIFVQSAAKEQGAIVFDFVANPETVRRIILGAQERAKSRQAAVDRERYRLQIENDLRRLIMPHTLPRQIHHTSQGTKVVTHRQRLRQLVNSWLSEEFRSGSSITWRKHWIVLLQQVGPWLTGLILLDVAGIVYTFTPAQAALPVNVYFTVALTLFVILLGNLLWQWDDWRNDIYTINETQIIDIERWPLGLREKSITAPLEQVQDVRLDVPGWLGLIFDFGDVFIETGGVGSKMIFRSVRHPREISNEVFKRLADYRTRREEKQASIQNRVVIDALVSYHRLKKEEERQERERGIAHAAEAAGRKQAEPSAENGMPSQLETDVTAITLANSAPAESADKFEDALDSPLANAEEENPESNIAISRDSHTEAAGAAAAEDAA